MELRQLEYVVAVADELHFGRAADRLHVAQQTVSEQVARLERELGAPLFARTSRRVRVTEVGEVFLPEARRALAQVRHAREVGRQAARTPVALRLGYPPNSGGQLSRLILPELARRAPNVRVFPVPAYTVELTEDVRGGRLDASLMWHPELSNELSGVRLFEVPVAVALPVDSPLAAADRLPHRMVAAKPLVMLVPRSVHPRLHDHLLAGLGRNGAGPVRVVAEAPSMDRLLPLVVAGVGLGITFTSLAHDGPPGVTFRRLEPPEPTSACWVVWRRSDHRVDLSQVIRALTGMRDDGLLANASLP